jgi:hypothetical protein
MLKFAMWPSTEGSHQAGAGSASMRALITGYQESAWRFSGLGGRDDDSFWMSGLYVPTADFEQARSVELQVLGYQFEPPIVSTGPITGPLQEKMSPPFILAAWNSIQKRARTPLRQKIGRTLFFATAPTNQLYPAILKARGLDRYVVVFDALFTMYFRGIVASVINVLYDASADADPMRQWMPKWSPCFKFERSALSIQVDHPDRYGSIAVLLYSALQVQLPAQILVKAREQSYKELSLTLTILNDCYAFMFAHELGHLENGHLKDDRYPSAIGLKDEGALRKELDADGHAFELLIGPVSSDEQLRTYVNVSILFHIMAFLYRAIHYAEHGVDYGALPPDALKRIYFSEDARLYPHPLARLQRLRVLSRSHSQSAPSGLDEWDSKIDEFFEQLWKPVLLYLRELEPTVSDVWSDVTKLNALAHGVAPSADRKG